MQRVGVVDAGVVCGPVVGDVNKPEFDIFDKGDGFRRVMDCSDFAKAEAAGDFPAEGNACSAGQG